MSQGEKGFTIIEMVVSIAIIAIIGLAANMTIFQVVNGTGRSNSHMTAVRQVQYAGYWIGRDAQMSENVTTDNLSGTDFLVLAWTEWDASDDTTTHSVTYYFEGLSDGIGKLKRSHWSSAGGNNETLVAKYVSYDPGDPVNTSNVSYQNPVLTVKLTALFGDAGETREYRIGCRPNL